MFRINRCVLTAALATEAAVTTAASSHPSFIVAGVEKKEAKRRNLKRSNEDFDD